MLNLSATATRVKGDVSDPEGVVSLCGAMILEFINLNVIKFTKRNAMYSHFGGKKTGDVAHITYEIIRVV